MTRFATCGSDNKIKIWDFTVIESANEEQKRREIEKEGKDLMEEEVGKEELEGRMGVEEEEGEEEGSKELLATLTEHTKSVMCVRWSKNGKYLASGGDDRIIFVWTLMDNSQAQTVFGEKTKNIENWKVVKALRGHKGDIADLCWSHDDRWLASCSLEGTVVVWDMSPTSFGRLARELKGHKGCVKGICFDPFSQYLSSQGEDNSVIFWRTSDWEKEEKVEKPFKGTAGTTFFRRLDWSPTGQHISATHGLNNKHHVAPILKRGSWTSEFDCVGHNSPIVVSVSFSSPKFSFSILHIPF